MRNFYILIVVVLNTARGCDGCSDEPKQCNGYVPYSQHMKDYFMFKDSSYWIYQDSFSGDIDSFWVNNFNKEDFWPYKITGTKKSPCYEIIHYKIYRKLSDNHEEVELSCRFLNKGIESENYRFTNIYRMKNNDTKFAIRFSAIGYDTIQNETPVQGGYNLKYQNIKINNKIYNDIIYLYYPIANTDDWIRKIYYAKHIGVVKFEDENERVWELIRHKVKQ